MLDSMKKHDEHEVEICFVNVDNENVKSIMSAEDFMHMLDYEDVTILQNHDKHYYYVPNAH